MQLWRSPSRGSSPAKFSICAYAAYWLANHKGKVLSYFKPEFTLGLTATPDRADGESILEDFKNVAHKLDLQQAVESYAKQYAWELINPANMKDKVIRWLSATNPLAT